MVGAPKHLSDLAKIEADVRITCRKCGFEDDWDRGELAKHLLAIGGSLVWSEVTRHMVCRRIGCGSSILRVAAVPFARRTANLPRRVGRLDQQTLEAALTILDDVARRRAGAVATTEVRLALLVLLRYSGQRDAAKLFWDRASIAIPLGTDSLHDPLASIRHALVQRGWIAPEAPLERTKTWPWNSPAPPGWYASLACPRNETEDGRPASPPDVS